LLAKDDEAVYEFLKKGYAGVEEAYIATNYKYNEDKVSTLYDENFCEIGTETFKERMIRLRGSINNEEAADNDLYYDNAFYKWKLLKENVNNEDYKDLIDLKVVVIA